MEYASRREILAWSMYDFANSAFSTTVVTVVFQTWFISSIVPAGGITALGMKFDGPTLWPVVYGTSMGLSALIAPFVGAICDHSASKKKALTFFWLAGCLATGSLFFAGTSWPLASLLFILANVCFEASVAINSAFLPELAPADQLDRISSIGWGIGYLGGGLCLFLNLLLIGNAGSIGLSKEMAVRIAVSGVGAWWLLAGLPCILGVKERAAPRRGPAVGAAFSKVFATLKQVRRLRSLWILTLSVLVFLAGVNTVLAMSTSFAKTKLAFDDESLITCFLMIQGVAAVGALAMAKLSAWIPAKRLLIGMLVVWLGAMIWASAMTRPGEFWALGVVIGLVMGGTQSLARGVQARLTPPSSTAEFFGLFSITQKLAIAAASYVFAVSVNRGGMGAGILSIGLCFAAGLLLLVPVDVDRGRREAVEEEERLQAGRAA